MKKNTAITIFESLSSPVRLDVYRLLIKQGIDGLVAGEIAASLELPSTNLSFHLKALTHAGLINVEQEGRFLRYRANLPVMVELIAYLTDECCAGKPQTCGNFSASAICPQCSE
jgi:ArsR family transcriptional regulator, arsenate/arsenite/antimonite-responsive transcriptional repressor